MTAKSVIPLSTPKPTPHSLVAALICAAITSSTLAQDNSSISDSAAPPIAAREATQSQIPVTHPLDWVPHKQVPKQLQDTRCEKCAGRYIDPLAGTDRSTRPETSETSAIAGSTELVGDVINLNDGVKIQQGYRHLSADSASLDRANNTGQLQGNIALREPGLLLRGEQASVNSDTGEATIDVSKFVLHEQHIRGTAAQFSRDSDGLLRLQQGSLSFCAPENDEWLIRADKLELDIEEGLGTAHGARIDIAGIPVFYAPWLRFPIDDRRRTGILWPDIGSDTKGGLDISAPVYFNLAPNYDLLYTPRFIQERGANHELKARYLSDQVGSWTVGGAFMNNDDRYRREYPAERNHDRWLGVIQHSGLIDRRWRSRVDYSKASDVNYMKDLETSSLDAKRETALLQLGSIDYLGDKWLASLDIQQYQSLADDITNDYKKLPQFTGQYRAAGAPFTVNPILLAQYSSFDTDTDKVVGERLYVEAGASYPMFWGHGFLKPTVKYRQLDYDLNAHPDLDSNSPSSGSALASLDGGLYFDRKTSFAGNGLVQTLEPRIYYLYSGYDRQLGQPDFDSAELTFTYNQLFRETRFSGRDRLDDANQLSIGVTTRFIDDEDGKEEFSASIGQIFYFRDRKVRLDPLDEPLKSSGSEVAGELTFNPNDRLNLRASLVWDPYSDEVNSGNLQTSYTRDDGSIYNIGYSYRRPLTLVTEQAPTEQLHFSAYFPVGRSWSFFAGVNYSIEEHTSVEDMFGVEYDSCCWKIRLLHLRYYDTAAGELNPNFSNPTLRREDSTQVQLVLKGMGGFGSRASSIMKDMIRGFTDSEY